MIYQRVMINGVEVTDPYAARAILDLQLDGNRLRADLDALRTRLAEVEKDAADMFWNNDDAEKPYGSIDEFLNDEICNGMPVEVGAIYTIQRAVALPKIQIRVTSVDDNECEAEYEVIDDAIGAQA